MEMSDDTLGFARKVAAKHGWAEIDHQANIMMVSFVKDGARVNVYYSKMTVATIVNHPRWGRNQMFRKHVGNEALCAIFRNPRAHLIRNGIPGYHQNGIHIASITRQQKTKKEKP